MEAQVPMTSDRLRGLDVSGSRGLQGRAVTKRCGGGCGRSWAQHRVSGSNGRVKCRILVPGARDVTARRYQPCEAPATNCPRLSPTANTLVCRNCITHASRCDDKVTRAKFAGFPQASRRYCFTWSLCTVIMRCRKSVSSFQENS